MMVLGLDMCCDVMLEEGAGNLGWIEMRAGGR